MNSLTGKTIRIFCLFLAAFIFNAHMIIPHDHHQTENEVCTGGTIPASNHHGFPYHCHAFNDLASEKATICTIITNLQCFDLIPGYLNEPINFHHGYLILFPLYVGKPANTAFSELSLLRAPPSLS